MKIQRSAAAGSDLDAIFDYTAEQWGVDQAAAYLAGLEQAMQRLGDFPELGASAADVRPGYRRLRHKRHVIFYRLAGSVIRIERILHERMDAANHLA